MRRQETRHHGPETLERPREGGTGPFRSPPKFHFVSFVVSIAGSFRARLLAVIAIGIAGSSASQAQFDFSKLTKKLGEVKENVVDAAKMAKGAGGVTLEEEKLVGDSVALEIIGTYGGIWRDEAATHRVNLIGNALARYCDRPGLEWRFGVLASDTINAFSAPAGYVFITKGLYSRLPDDDSLAAVLAHEIAHIVDKHALKIIGRGEFLSGMGNQLMKRSSEAREAKAKADEQLRQFDVGISDIVKILLENGFDPQTEYVADADGRSLAITAGYAPGALRTVLLRLKSESKESDKLFSTHPPIDARVAKLPNDPAPPPAPAAPEEKPAAEAKS